MRSTRLILRGVRKRAFRSAATALCFALIAGSISVASVLLAGAQASVAAADSRMGADMMLMLENYTTRDQVLLVGEPTSTFFFSSQLSLALATPGVAQATPQLYVLLELGSSDDSPPLASHLGGGDTDYSNATILVGFDPDTDFLLKPWLDGVDISQMSDGETLLGSSMIVNASATEILGRQFSAIGNLEKTGTLADRSVFITMDSMHSVISEVSEAMPYWIRPGTYSAIMIRVEPGWDPEEVASGLKARLPAVYVATPMAIASNTENRLSSIISGLNLTALSIVGVTVPMVALVSTMVANERRKEFGILRALGGTRPYVFSIVFLEAVVLATIGAVAGVVSGLGALWLIGELFGAGMQASFVWPSAWTVALASVPAITAAVLVGGAAAIYPAIRASKEEPYATIRKGSQ